MLRIRLPGKGRQNEPSVQGGSAEQAVGRAIVRHWFKNNGQRLHLYAQLVRHRLCGLRDRRLCVADRRPA